jgi:hypothetical protein
MGSCVARMIEGWQGKSDGGMLLCSIFQGRFFLCFSYFAPSHSIDFCSCTLSLALLSPYFLLLPFAT